MANILVVEDDLRICNILDDYFTEDGHNCFVIKDGIQAMKSLMATNPDIVILDLMLPNLDGYKICQLIRTVSDVPIIILTAKGEETDKLKGYDLGADDYVTKPFSPKVLVAKVNALLKRSENKENKELITKGILTLISSERTVYVNGDVVNLTYKEFEMLNLFIQNPGMVFTREQLLNKIWGYEFAGTTRTVDTHIKTLRQKLGPAGSYIVTMIRSGYKFEVR